MYALAPRRCAHCVSVLATVPLDHAEEFGLRGPAVVCRQCDVAPHPGQTLHMPDDWE